MSCHVGRRHIGDFMEIKTLDKNGTSPFALNVAREQRVDIILINDLLLVLLDNMFIMGVVPRLVGAWSFSGAALVLRLFWCGRFLVRY